MEKLPPTSYVRMVDIWLICGQLIPFVEVILLTIRELYDDHEFINHHGVVTRKTVPAYITGDNKIQVLINKRLCPYHITLGSTCVY